MAHTFTHKSEKTNENIHRYISNVVDFIVIFRLVCNGVVYGERKRNFVGQHFWARGYFVSTVGRNEAVIRAYIRHQEREDQRLEQLNLWR